MKICDFDRLFSFDSYLLNFCSNFTNMVAIESLKPGPSDWEFVQAFQSSIIFFQYFYTSEHKKSDVMIGPISHDIFLYSPTGEQNSKNKFTK